MPSIAKWSWASLVGAFALQTSARAVERQQPHLTGYVKDLFDESMNFLDTIYDRSAGYLYFFYYPLAAGKHETRSSVWYATGLLQRNRGDDVEEAVKILRNVIGDQKKDPRMQWYGDYTVYPEEPSVGTDAYPPVIYNSWDPNWRGFIGTNLIVIYEEFRHLLPVDVQELILESMFNNTIGDSYRVGGVDDDNLFPSYSNPWLMRAVATGWTGLKFNESNMTAAGEMYAKEAIDLFNMYDTLSEFNSGTYAGVSLYALTLWAKYMPDTSLMGQNGARMIQKVWDSLSELYHADLKNLAGPWDRAYGYDMNNYVAIVSLYIWSLAGKAKAPVNSQTWSMAHADDFEYAPLIAVLAPYHNSLIPEATVAKLSAFPGPHLYEASAYSPPHDVVPRNVTSWLDHNLTIGAQSYVEDVLGGPRNDSSQWNPAVVQWMQCSEVPNSVSTVGYITLHPGETALQAQVSRGSLNLTYPSGTHQSKFTFLVSSNPVWSKKRDITGFEDLEGISVKVSGSVSVHSPIITFCGLVGGSCSVNHGFEFWNFTYVMPENSTQTPNIHLEITTN